MEEWRDVAGWEEYEVSNLGNIRSKDRWVIYSDGDRHFYKGKEKKQQVHIKTGYKLVFLHSGGKMGRNKMLRVHRLVAQAFLPNPGGKPDVNHKNCNRQDNRAENLEWCTRKENIVHRFRHGDRTTTNCATLCVETGQIFQSRVEAGNSCGVECKDICRAIKSGGKSGGYHWKSLISLQEKGKLRCQKK